MHQMDNFKIKHQTLCVCVCVCVCVIFWSKAQGNEFRQSYKSSQQPISGPCAKLYETSPYLCSCFLNIHSNIIPPSMTRSPK